MTTQTVQTNSPDAKTVAAKKMVQLANARFVAYLPEGSESAAKRLRSKSPILKYARIGEVSNFNWENVVYGQVYSRTDADTITNLEAAPPTQSEIMTAYNVAKKLTKAPWVTIPPEILNRALSIVMSKDYYAEKTYMVTAHSCDCPDAVYRQRRCKHITAVWLEHKIWELRKERATEELAEAQVG